MIRISKDNTGKTYQVEVINPITENIAISADGYESVDEAVQDVADIYTALTDTDMTVEQMKEKIEVIE